MAYQIDQSGKLEHTSKNTYIALANGKTIIIKISSIEKRKVIEVIKEYYRPNRTYVFQIFAVLIYLLIIKSRAPSVLIDNEYDGHQGSIKEILVQLFQRFGEKMPIIEFGLVGKKSPAHKAAISAFRGKKTVDITVKAEDVLQVLY